MTCFSNLGKEYNHEKGIFHVFMHIYTYWKLYPTCVPGGLLEEPPYFLVWEMVSFLGNKSLLVSLFLLSAVSIFLVMALVLWRSSVT